MKSTEQTGARTLFMSLMLSSPGPIVVGIGLFVGNSSTQMADFVRRTAELFAIFVSYFIYRILHKEDSEVDNYRREKLERAANLCVGVTMCLSGLSMLLIALLGGSAEKGNVIPGLSIAFLGLATNSWFWFRYAKLSKQSGNAILTVQSYLYRAKSFVDACVFAVLLTVLIAPQSDLAQWADIGGSIIVSAYLIVNGINIIKKYLTRQYG